MLEKDLFSISVWLQAQKSKAYIKYKVEVLFFNNIGNVVWGV